MRGYSAVPGKGLHKNMDVFDPSLTPVFGDQAWATGGEYKEQHGTFSGAREMVAGVFLKSCNRGHERAPGFNMPFC